MDFSALQSIFAIKNNKISRKTLSLSSSDFPGTLSDFFTLCYNDRTLNLSQVKLVAVDDKNQRIEITGVGSYLEVPDVQARIQCWLDDSQQVQLTVAYQLLGANPGPNDWRFSKSFPDLPKTPDETQPILFDRETGESWQKERVPLDDFAFFNASFVASSCDTVDSQSQQPLKKGINFLAKIRPEGPLAIAANAFKVTSELSVHGRIRLPVRGETTAKLRTQFMDTGANFLFPWHVDDQVEHGLPGILLTIAIGINDSLGKNTLTLDADSLMVYTPISDDWVMSSTNPAFKPVQGFSGSMAIPSASIETDITLPFEPGIHQWLGIAQCEGLSLGNLSQMAGLSGSKDGFMGNLPKELQKMGKGLGKLAFTGFSVRVDYSDLKAIAVKNITVEIGMPELNWEIWPDRFELTRISCTFTIDNPFSTQKTKPRIISTKLQASMDLGDVSCSVTADSRDHFTLYAQMDAGNTIPLGQLLKKYASDIPVPAELTVSTLRLGVSPGNSYSLAMAMDGEEGSFPIPIGPATLQVDDISMFVAYEKSQGFRGSVSGVVNYRNYSLSMTYDTPGDVLIYSYIPKTSLNELLTTFTAGELKLPKSFDLDFENNTVQIQKAGKDYTFVLVTEVANTGSLALQIGKQQGQWGTAFGLVLNESKISKLPGLQALKVIDDTVTLTELTLLVSSFDSPSFTFPEMAAFSNPSLSSSSIPMPSGGGVVAGFNAHASWQLDTKQKDMKLLKQILGLDPAIEVTLQVAENPSDATRLFTSISTKLMGKYPLAAQFGFMLEKGKVSLFLAGQLTLKIQKQPVNFNMAMSLLPTGVYFAGSATGTINFGNVKLSNMGLALGVNWGGIPSVGIAAQIDTKKFSSSIAVIADSTDPSKSVLAGSVSQMTLADITREFAKVVKLPAEVNKVFKSIKLRAVRTFAIDSKTVNALDGKDYAAVSAAFAAVEVAISASEEMLLIVVRKQGRIWSLTDMAQGMRHYTVTLKGKVLEVAITPQVYIAPTGARMGTLTFTQGYFLSGCLQILGQRWATQVEISDRKGIAATSYMDKPLQIVHKDFFRFSDYDNKRGPLISLSSFKQPKHEIPALRNPHMALSGRLRLLGQESAALANITTKGVDIIVESDTTITIKESFISGRYDLDWKIAGSLGSPTDMFLSGAINFGLSGKFDLAKLLTVKADLGKIIVDTSVKADTEMGYQNNKAYVELDATFAFAGSHFTFTAEADAKNAQIEKLAKQVLNEIKSVVTTLYDTAEEWINALDKGVVEIGKAAGTVGKALKSGYKQTAKDATQLLHKTGRTAEQIGGELKSGFNTGVQEAVKLLGEVGIKPDDIGKVARKTYKQTEAQAAKLLKNAGHGADDIGRMLKGAYGSSSASIAKALKGVGHDANTVAKTLKTVAKATPASIAKDLKSAGINAHDIGRAMKGIGQTDEAVVKLLKGAGFPVKDVSKAMKNTLKISSETAAKYLRSAGFSSNDIAKMLKAGDLWNKGHKSVGKIMKKAGFGKSTVKSAMKAAGFAKKKIEQAFGWLKF